MAKKDVGESRRDLYKSIFSKSGRSFMMDEEDEHVEADISVDPPTSSTGGFSHRR